jgi:nucleoside-diphosphate-sugar epimerase
LSAITDIEAIKIIKGHEIAVFAGGIDDRAILKKPAYEKFHRINVKFCARFISLCKKAGVKKAIILSSYFSYFDRIMPEMGLSKKHIYIKSRVEQRQACMAIASKDFKVVILELPYIFGATPGKKVLWTPLIKYVNSFPLIFFMRGGTAMVGVKTVAKAAYGATKLDESIALPVYSENVSWKDWIERILKLSGKNPKPIIFVPKLLAKAGVFFIKLMHWIKGVEGGLEPLSYMDFQYMESFINDENAQTMLGIKNESINKSLKESIDEALK